MKIAITGGAGFIGTQLAVLLKNQKHELVLLDVQKSPAFRDDSRFIDVTNAQAVMDVLTGADVIYHLAAEHRDDVRPTQKYYEVNVGGAENVVAAARAHDIKTIIFTSSVAVYGLNAGDSKESDRPKPFNDYGKSKLESEKIFEAWAAEDASRNLITVRLVATFGPGNRGNIYNLMHQMARGKFMMVGSGRNRKSIAYVANVAAFLTHCLKLKGQHVYNYADKPDLEMNEMVKLVRQNLKLNEKVPRIPYIAGLLGGAAFDVAAKVTGKTFPVSAVRVQKFCADTVVNAEKMRETGFQPANSLAEGLKEMIKAEF